MTTFGKLLIKLILRVKIHDIIDHLIIALNIQNIFMLNLVLGLMIVIPLHKSFDDMLLKFIEFIFFVLKADYFGDKFIFLPAAVWHFVDLEIFAGG